MRAREGFEIAKRRLNWLPFAKPSESCRVSDPHKQEERDLRGKDDGTNLGSRSWSWEWSQSGTGAVVQIDEGHIRAHLDDVVLSTVEETLNTLLDAEADRLCGARKY